MRTIVKLAALALVGPLVGYSLHLVQARNDLDLWFADCETINSIGEGHAEGGFTNARINARDRAQNAALEQLEESCSELKNSSSCEAACEPGHAANGQLSSGSVTYTTLSAPHTALPNGGYSWDVRVQATGECCCLCYKYS